MNDYEEILRRETKNKHYSERYIKFINDRTNRDLDASDYYENHHIIPTATGFGCDKLVRLTAKEHWVAHWMLAKIFGGNMWFAFNMMRRVGKTSILYEYGRKYIAEQSRIMNTDRPKSLKNRKSISKRTRNTVVVRDSDGNMFRVIKTDPRYISGELVFYRVGYKHDENTKKKISASNKGKTVIISEEQKKKISKSVSGLIWVTIKNDGSVIRIKKEEFDPDLHERGRRGFRGFDYINSRRKIIIDE